MILRDIILEQLFATPAGTEFDLRNTPFFNILRANPSFAIIYADFLRRHNANPSLIKNLEVQSGFFFNPDQSLKNQNPKGSTPMAFHKSDRVCTHIKVNGIRCGSPALREEVFCYFHQRMFRGVPTPPNSRLHPIAMLEDEQSIQASLMEIINALVRNQIDVARARLIMRALHIAVKNAGKTRFHCWESDMVSEIPEYPRAPQSTGPFGPALAQAAALTTIQQPQEEESEPERLSGLFYSAPDDPKRRKPPACIKTTLRSLSASRARSAENKIRLRQLQPNRKNNLQDNQKGKYEHKKTAGQFRGTANSPLTQLRTTSTENLEPRTS